MAYLECKDLELGYEDKTIIKNLNISVAKGEIVSIIGPNGSGKSTLLRSIAKLLEAKSSEILIEKQALSSMSMKALAKKLSMLFQRNVCPSDITVEKLVFYGRTPHKKWYESRSDEDKKIVDKAMKQTGIYHMKEKAVCNLSGGESQRVWLAMAIAQEPEILLLDEPTTYLDIGYQLELLEFIKKLNDENKTTIIMVLHELNQAAQYSDRIFVLKDSKLYDHGRPEKVINKEMLIDVYGVDARIIYDENNKPIVIPRRKEIDKI